MTESRCPQDFFYSHSMVPFFSASSKSDCYTYTMTCHRKDWNPQTYINIMSESAKHSMFVTINERLLPDA